VTESEGSTKNEGVSGGSLIDGAAHNAAAPILAKGLFERRSNLSRSR
jgi:hypothetical protein